MNQLNLFGGTQISNTMKNAGKDNKKEVWAELDPIKQQELVYTIGKRLMIATDNEVARLLRVAPSTISARRNTLMEENRVRFIMNPETGKPIKVKDRITKRPNVTWSAVV